jgi:ribosomal protein S18 acetylase RimI-like enzyme
MGLIPLVSRKDYGMLIAILTFDGFNELDSLISLGILGRVRKAGWRVSIASPSPHVVSMNAVVIDRAISLEQACEADAVIVGSGVSTREIVADPVRLAAIQLDPRKQLVGSQCSGALVLAKLGLLQGVPACTDLTTAPWVRESGVEVLKQPFYAKGNIATAGGCLASQYLAGWMIARLEGVDAAEHALHYVAPVGEKDDYVSRAMRHILKYLPNNQPRTAWSAHSVPQGQFGALRVAETEDLKIVASWVTSARDCELWTGWRVSFPIDLTTLPASLQFSEDNAYVWIINAQIAAFGQVVKKADGRAHLGSIIVDPLLRRRGHGEQFVRALLVQAHARSPLISLNVDAQNSAAISLYQRLGFADALRPPDEPLSPGSRYMESGRGEAS